MKRKYRIRVIGRDENDLMEVRVEMELIKDLVWVYIKSFKDDDYDFAKREAEELLESLEGGRNVKVKLL